MGDDGDDDGDSGSSGSTDGIALMGMPSRKGRGLANKTKAALETRIDVGAGRGTKKKCALPQSFKSGWGKF